MPIGPVWRNEKPGPGRFRQFMQFDADTVGTDNLAADAEMCMLAADTLEALGIKRGDYLIKVNNRKVLDGVLEADRILAATANADGALIVLRAIDKLDRLGRTACAHCSATAARTRAATSPRAQAQCRASRRACCAAGSRRSTARATETLIGCRWRGQRHRLAEGA